MIFLEQHQSGSLDCLGQMWTWVGGDSIDIAVVYEWPLQYRCQVVVMDYRCPPVSLDYESQAVKLDYKARKNDQ